MSSLSADSAAIVATATAPAPPGASIPPLLTAKPRGNPNLHLTPCTACPR